MSLLKLQGALLWRTESLWIGLRKYSSAKVKEEARRRWVLEQAELLEVLEARVKQLQTEVRMNTVPLSQLGKSSFFQPSPPWKATTLSPARTETTAKSSEGAGPQPSRWMEKLNKEKSIKHKRLLRLEAKLARVSSNLVAKPTSKRTQGAEDRLERLAKERSAGRKVKSQPLESTRGLRGRKKAAVTEGPSLPSGRIKELEKCISDLPLPLEEDNGHQHGNLQLSILSYLDTCLFLRQPEKALQCLMFYHRSHARRKQLDVRMYNLVMHEYAKKRALAQIGSLFRLMDEVGVKPNQDSYIAALSCMGKSDVHPNIIARCLQQLEEDGFRPEELFQNYVRGGNEVEMALEGIRKARPGFQLPPHPEEAEICTIPLLQDFYRKDKPVSYPKMDFSAKYLQKQFRKQLAMEASDTVTIDSVEAEKPLTEKAAQARALLAELRSRWRASLLQGLQESKLHLDRKNSGKMNLYPFLCVLDDKEYIDILMQSLSVLPPHGESLLILARELGTKVYNKYVIKKKSRSRLVKKIKAIYNSYVQLLANDTQPNDLLPREYWEKLASEAGCASSLVSKECIWPHSVLVQLGLHLVELLVQVLKMESNLLNPALEQKLIPVLYHVYSFRSGRQIGFIRPHPILTRLLLDAAETNLTFETFVIPMLCPPVPWVSPHFGAYVLAPTKLMRYVEGAHQHQILLDRCPSSNLHPVMDSLNQLGNCPWKVNGPILDVVISIFNEKGDEKLDIPPPPSEAPQPGTGGPLSKAALKREVARCRKKAVEMYSLRMDALYKLSIAKHMKDQVFWFPHNMDFRGRTYPCPPHFNHLGSDLTRALLLFAEGRPLGSRGLDWLKIHLINLTGLKKRNSLQERLAYANEIMADILDSADHPLTGRKWWMNTDEPWQALACCMEIAKATRAPDPAAFVSHFPVHQDGSCNGLQHYAALGRDVVGAASVNLTPCDVPQDVYSVVAQQVEVFRKRDAAAGIKTAQLLEGFIGRKVVKQTVMTVVYGVTRYGGRLQIEKRLKEIDDFPQEYVWEASHYLVQQVFSSLKEMFSGTREIQAWLTDCARLIAKSGRTVEWVTPLGLPIIQPYHRSKITMVNSSMQTVNLKSRHDISQKPDTMKQKNAFPPNFIHSLDSTHMMLTSLHCHRQGLTFVSVHDCYWTHALTVDVMNRICRDQFVALHSQPILEFLSRFMLQKYCTQLPVEWKNKKSLEYQKLLLLLSSVPKKGDFNLEKVKESTYFFS